MNDLETLVKDLYGKYAPDSYSDDKVQYVKDNYTDPQEFVKDFYGKYAPDKYSDEVVSYINDNYLSNVKKKDQPQPSTESVSEDVELVTEEQPTDGGSESTLPQPDAQSEIDKIRTAGLGTDQQLADFDASRIEQALGTQAMEVAAEGAKEIQLQQDVLQTDPSVIDGSLRLARDNRVKIEIESITPLKMDLEDKQKKLEEAKLLMTEQPTQESVAQYNAIAEEYNVIASEYNNAGRTYKEALNAEAEMLKLKTIKEAQKGTFGGAIRNSMVMGEGSIMKGVTRAATELMSLVLPDEMISPDLSSGEKTREEVLNNLEVDFVQKIGNDLLTAWGTEETTPEYIEKKQEEFWGGAIIGLARSVPAMTGGLPTLITQAYNDGYETIDEVAGDKMTRNEKQMYGLAFGTVQGVLEKVGLQSIMNKGLISRVTNEAIDRIIKSGEKVTASRLSQVATEIAAPLVRGGSGEFLTGAGQEVGSIGLEQLTNALKDDQIFDTQSFKEYAERVLVSGAQEAVGGFIMSAPAAVNRGIKATSPKEYDVADKAVKMAEEIAEYIEVKRKSEEITEQEADELLRDTKEFIETNSKIPEELDPEQKLEAFQLLKEKSQLEAEIEGKDPALVKGKIERIKGKKNADGTETKGIDQELEEIGAGKKRKPKNVVVEPDVELDTQIEQASEQELTEINEEYGRIEAETTVATEGAETQINEETETKEEAKKPKRDVRVEIAEDMLPDINKSGEVSSVAITDNVTADVSVKVAPDGENIYSIQIKRDGEVVEDKNGDTEIEFTSDETADVLKYLNQKQKGFILSKAPKAERAAPVVQDGQIPDGTPVTFSVFGQSKSGVMQGGRVIGDNGTKYVTSMVSNITPKTTAQTNVTQKVSLKPDKITKEVRVKPDVKQTKPNVQTKKTETKAKEVKVKEKQSLRLIKNADEAIEWLDRLENQIDKFGRETLGTNLPVVIFKGAIKVAKTSIKAGKTVAQAIIDAENYVKSSKWYQSLTATEQVEADKDVDEMFNKPTTTFSPQDGARMAEQAFKESDEAMKKSKPKTTKESVKKATQKLRVAITDRQATVKDVLDKIGATRAKNALINLHGASGYANVLYKKAYKEIYRGLNSKDQVILDKIIMLRRIIEIDNARDAAGELRPKHPANLNAESSAAALQYYEQDLGKAKYDKLIARSDKYFDQYKNLLKMAYDAGIISQESYDRFKDMNYQPRRFVKYLFDANVSPAQRDAALRSMAYENGVSYDFFKRLADGSESAIFYDSRFLLQASINSITKRVAQNNANRLLFEDFMKLSPQERAANEQIRERKIVGNTTQGAPIYQEAPDGYVPIIYQEAGIQRSFFIKTDLYDQWYDLTRVLTPETADLISKASGTRILKAMATGMNPLFIITNVPRDFGHILMFTKAYDSVKILGVPFLPANGFFLAKDAAKMFWGMWFRNKSVVGLFEQAAQDGMLMDFLSIQGRYQGGRAARFQGAANKTMVKIGEILSFLGEKSEIAFRLAVYEKTLKDQTKEFEKDNGALPVGEDLDAIRGEAAATARSIIDFNQGGTHIKAAETVLPYVNAATQGFRVSSSYIAKNPVDFVAKFVQAAGFMAALTIYNLRVFGDDYDDVPDYDKMKNFIFMLPVKDKDGRRKYIKIAKTQEMIPFFMAAETAAEMLYLQSNNLDTKERSQIRDERMMESVHEYFPLSPEPKQLLARNPIYSGLIAYITNYDLYRDDPIAKDFNKILPKDEGKYSTSVASLYKKVGEETGLSPQRTQVAVEKIITSPSTNPLVGLVYLGGEVMFNDTNLEEEYEKTLSKQLGGIERKFLKSVNPEWRTFKNKELLNIERMKNGSEKLEINHKLKTLAKKNRANLVDVENPTGDELFTKEVEDFISTLPPEEQESYVKKYIGYALSDGVPYSYFNVAYERDPEVQVMMFRAEFGDPYKMSKEEQNEVFGVFAGKLLWTPPERFWIIAKRMSDKEPQE